ncbi:MAG: S9 family peptidase [Pedobacter sp.]|nr:MAG: S9 family peptidase [Pedobacter sp.]
MKLRSYLLFFIMILLWSCQKDQKAEVIPVNNFFKTQDLTGYRISPDGKSLSYLKLQDKKQNLFVENIASGEVVQLTHVSEKNIGFYSWVSDNELIYYKEKDGQNKKSDLFIIDKEGKNERQINTDDNARLRILEENLIDNKYLLVLSNKRDSTVSDVYRLNVRDGKMQMVTQNPGKIAGWMTDSKGKLRLSVVNDGVKQTIQSRLNENEPFRSVLSIDFKTTFNPIAFSETNPQHLYAISDINRDRPALVEINCITGEEVRVLFASDSLTVVDAQYSKIKGRMEYAVYESWKKQKHYLNVEAENFYSKLDQLLPNTEYRIFSQDNTETLFLIRTFTDKNPGSYYLYNAISNTIRKLSDLNASIEERLMSPMKPVQFNARDGIQINGYLTIPNNSSGKNLPVVVFPHNGPGQRNTWGYNAEVQFFASRGYAVFQLNYRGSSGYGKNFYAAGFKEWNGKVQDDIEDGVKWLIENNYANPEKIALYGNGFGGYLAINAAIRNPNLYQAVASNSGVLNLFNYLNTIPPIFRANLQMYYEILGNPDTDVDYMRQASPVFHADKINMPVFITQNTKEPRLNNSDAIRLVKELKKRQIEVTYFQKEDGSSSVSREGNRQQLYASLEQFLNQHLNKK